MTSIQKVKGKGAGVMAKIRFCRALRLECRVLLSEISCLSDNSTMATRREHDEATKAAKLKARSNA